MSNDISPREIAAIANAVADKLRPVIAASGSIDLTILEGPVPDTGMVRYAAYPIDPNTGLPAWFAMAQTLQTHKHLLTPDGVLSLIENVGCDGDGNLGSWNPASAEFMKHDRDPALLLDGKTGQWFGFAGKVFAYRSDPAAPMGYTTDGNAIPGGVSARFPSVETMLRKALKG